MRHRIFIAINLPEEIKQELVNHQEKWSDLPARWTKKDNLHITLEFLGYVSEDEIVSVLEKTRELASKHKPFFISLNKICYGPPHQKNGEGQASQKPPRMVWVVGEKIQELNLTPHITLARIRTWQFKQIEVEERPEIDETIDLRFEVGSLEVMESKLKRTGPDYIILESCPLRN